MSYIADIRKQLVETTHKVQFILGWDDLTLAAYMEKKGIEYLAFTYDSQQIQQQLAASSEFWSWWRLHWFSRDLDFLEVAHLLFDYEAETHYDTVHDATKIAFKPHTHTLRASWGTVLIINPKDSTE